MHAVLTYASAISISVPGQFGLPYNCGGLLWVLGNISNTLLGLVATASVLFIIIGGFQYVTSAGNDEKLQKAKKTIMMAIQGMTLAILAWSLINILVTGTPLKTASQALQACEETTTASGAATSTK